ncbi:hypothetical protein JW905_10985 [bacterium]|nr:hypothetical protein [candidate division CSSED10-310 bacterium]
MRNRAFDPLDRGRRTGGSRGGKSGTRTSPSGRQRTADTLGGTAEGGTGGAPPNQRPGDVASKMRQRRPRRGSPGEPGGIPGYLFWIAGGLLVVIVALLLFLQVDDEKTAGPVISLPWISQSSFRPRIPVKLERADFMSVEEQQAFETMRGALDGTVKRVVPDCSGAYTKINELITTYIDPYLLRELPVEGYPLGRDDDPQFWSIYETCCRVMHMSPDTVLFIVPDREYDVACFSLGLCEPHILMTRKFLSVFSYPDGSYREQEIAFILGRELGKLKCEQQFDKIALGLFDYLANLYKTPENVPAALKPILNLVMKDMAGGLLKMGWLAATSSTCDNAGLICCQNLDFAEAAMIRYNSGYDGPIDVVAYEAYWENYMATHGEQMENMARWLEGTMPLQRRIAKLKEFYGIRYKDIM